jgi:hypothetical protein
MRGYMNRIQILLTLLLSGSTLASQIAHAAALDAQHLGPVAIADDPTNIYEKFCKEVYPDFNRIKIGPRSKIRNKVEELYTKAPRFLIKNYVLDMINYFKTTKKIEPEDYEKIFDEYVRLSQFNLALQRIIQQSRAAELLSQPSASREPFPISSNVIPAAKIAHLQELARETQAYFAQEAIKAREKAEEEQKQARIKAMQEQEAQLQLEQALAAEIAKAKQDMEHLYYEEQERYRLEFERQLEEQRKQAYLAQEAIKAKQAEELKNKEHARLQQEVQQKAELKRLEKQRQETAQETLARLNLSQAAQQSAQPQQHTDNDLQDLQAKIQHLEKLAQSLAEAISKNNGQRNLEQTQQQNALRSYVKLGVEGATAQEKERHKSCIEAAYNADIASVKALLNAGVPVDCIHISTRYNATPLIATMMGALERFERTKEPQIIAIELLRYLLLEKNANFKLSDGLSNTIADYVIDYAEKTLDTWPLHWLMRAPDFNARIPRKENMSVGGWFTKITTIRLQKEREALIMQAVQSPQSAHVVNQEYQQRVIQLQTMATQESLPRS